VKAKGAPVELVFPKEGLGWDIEASGIVKTTKKMDAAKKLMDWTVTQEAEPGLLEELRHRRPSRGEARAAAHPGGPRGEADQERLRVRRQEPRQDPREWQKRYAAKTESKRRMGDFLELTGIRKEFGDFAALKGVSLGVRQGELICFLGPRAAARPRCCASSRGSRCRAPGPSCQAGRDISRLPPMKRDYGIVFQSYALFPNLSVADNVAYGLVNAHARGTARRAREGASRAGGPARQRRKVPEPALRRPAAAHRDRARARDLAGVLLLDEPLSALDARVRVRLRGEIRSLQQRVGITTVLVTHDQEEALSMADRIVVMKDGQIEQIGTPDEVYGRPATPFVADFVGKTNLLPAKRDGADRVQVGEQRFQCPMVDYALQRLGAAGVLPARGRHRCAA
jgi:iron(III) transport system ATP-binding protein